MAFIDGTGSAGPTKPAATGPADTPLDHVSALVDEFQRSTCREHEGPLGLLFELLDEESDG